MDLTAQKRLAKLVANAKHITDTNSGHEIQKEQAIAAVADRTRMDFQKLADEAFADLLRKHKQPVGLRAALKESVGARRRRPAKG